MITCWEMADLLALLYVLFCHFVPYGVLGQMRYLIVSISDHCLLSYFERLHTATWLYILDTHHALDLSNYIV